MNLEHPITVGTAEFNADQHRYYDWMRREAPVYRGRLALRPPDQDVYFVSRYQDCANLVTDPRIRRVLDGAAEDASVVPEAIRVLTTDTMVYQDDPSHLRLRKLVSRPFTPRAIERLGDRIRTVARELLDGFEPGQRIELHQQYALPVPTTVISEIVGVASEDRSTFYAFIELLFEAMLNHNAAGAAQQMEAFVAYLREMVEQRRADPGADIITELITAREDGGLTDDEIVAMVFLLITGDYQTTPNVITNGVAALLAHPDQLRLLHQRPELIGSAVEEILRYSGTVGGTEATTFAGEDITLHGVTIPRGSMVTTLLTSANRDPAQFPDPDRFDITRSPNNHLAFSKGTHFCLGSHLARLETGIIIGELIGRFPNLTLAFAPEDLRLQPIPLLNRFDEVPLVLA
ncbi:MULTISPECIES: cytochrome P450 [unclassified Mycobacterium]|uniref:cytochrome P450 family protein n=1 Tax=unclassified Mycobacterium TaxID=2642494 RepID=UPI00274118DC|nr:MULTISPECIES: cytochrome P450 [unclassified Mycobacterium]MDP7702576.1 cytochrome P450 [Mycobacterium sp. TY815]MDP7721069.1 cytochrome P450 [Mycobacterium sp. TY814]